MRYRCSCNPHISWEGITGSFTCDSKAHYSYIEAQKVFLPGHGGFLRNCGSFPYKVHVGITGKMIKGGSKWACVNLSLCGW